MARSYLVDPGQSVPLPARGAFPKQVHLFEPESLQAINAAMAARRPLLVRGEPGTGKSQLAHASAAALGLPCVSMTIDARTEARDLLWKFDAVSRLGLAQVLGALEGVTRETLFEELSEERFVRPGPLWWGFDWESAARCETPSDGEDQAQPVPRDWTPRRPVVVLIDEIDKADSDVPNGLLEALGQGEFRPQGQKRPVSMNPEAPPLVVITTNEERALPDAFLRRCLVLSLELPTEGAELVELLIARGQAHFPDLVEEILREAAELLERDRSFVRERGLTPPGQAEYLDLLRAVEELADSPESRLDLVRELARYTYQKHPEARQS